MAIMGISEDCLDHESMWLKMVPSELGQSFVRLIFVFSDQHQQFVAIIAKAKRLASQKVGARDGGTDVFFNVVDDASRPQVMQHVRRPLRVVHRVGEIPHQHHVLAIAR